MPSHKISRIESDIIKYLSNILYTECDDDFLKTVTLTDIEVAKDLSLAKIYFTTIMDITHQEAEKEINEASSFLRGKLASRIEIRNIPELKFIYDETIEYANKIENIIKEIKK